MAVSDEIGALTRAFSGLGIDEKSLISILGKWHPEQRNSFRKGTRNFFIEDERQFERWDDRHIIQLEREFLRFKNAMVLWTMHPWERDARLAKEALYKGPQYGVLIEIACTRSSEELLGARRAYHSLFERSIEEEVASRVGGIERKLLVALLSSYRYEGPRVNEEIAKTEAKTLCNAIKNAGKKPAIEEEEVLRILTTRSKLHIKAVYKHYKEISGKYLDQDLDAELGLKETVQCLCLPQTYFSKVRSKYIILPPKFPTLFSNKYFHKNISSQVLDDALKTSVDEITKETVTRVIVTRADADMKQIKEEYHQKYGATLSKKIEDVANGNYREFLLTLVARGDQ
ncbi:unnamed protein product [Ilex paraguariensis]|uniref:Annexin n=1 Tax=Ilex paraguariensis TaxID=185542 RepID=A0ABC8U540_9AQUA